MNPIHTPFAEAWKVNEFFIRKKPQCTANYAGILLKNNQNQFYTLMKRLLNFQMHYKRQGNHPTPCAEIANVFNGVSPKNNDNNIILEASMIKVSRLGCMQCDYYHQSNGF